MCKDKKTDLSSPGKNENEGSLAKEQKFHPERLIINRLRVMKCIHFPVLTC